MGMNTQTQEALKLALEALQYLCKPLSHGWEAETQKEKRDQAITAIREALAEHIPDAGKMVEQSTCKQALQVEQTAQQQEPVAVARVDDLERGGRVRALAMGLSLDAPLYTSPPAAQQQEPVARSKAYDMIDRFLQNNLNSDDDYAEYSTALDSLYTSPQPAQPSKPLTDEQRQYVVEMWRGGNWTAGDIIDAVEAAHGIKGSA